MLGFALSDKRFDGHKKRTDDRQAYLILMGTALVCVRNQKVSEDFLSGVELIPLCQDKGILTTRMHEQTRIRMMRELMHLHEQSQPVIK